ncbi:ABC transporter ATP-binding protein [Butyrivibrio sp. INlla14]|uniref:ABC transporter ATP-binding protein n=1 Tax=Butyrivibrio sp. INlla14 TaxID=1520808 RepID=UPI000876FEA2|nr:ABC transporter ATP-binding protein [Butyrivibrio sp. INlla14]SCX95290.1 ABC-2 type transport system ATP-binding protein [Butyrivibrio sp. INlla14]
MGSETSNAAIRLDNIIKSYGKHDVLKGVTMQVNKGDIYGLVGKNGAGKTTIFKMILGLSEYTSGSVSIAGSQNRKELFANRSKVGFFVGSNFYGYLSGKANLEYYAAAKGLKGKALKQEVDRVLNVVGLTGGKENQKAKGYSLGMKQRLGIGNAILGNPDILILDEPTNGLDPQGIADIRHMIRRFRDEFGMTVIVSSHILGELENTADRFGIVHNGVIAKEITQDDLSAKRPEVELTVSAGNLERAKSILAENGIDILKEGKEKVTLEDYYFELIGGSAE